MNKFSQNIIIGDVSIKKTCALAPMASVADYAYRAVCKKYGACYVVGEMASAKGLFYSDKKTAELLTVTEEEMPMAIQLFGDEPETMAKAAQIASTYRPQIIDVNMGCPVPKIAGNGSGAALMKTPELAYSIIKAMVKAVDIPITVKIRKGWDENNVNAPQFAKLMQDAGAQAITIHGRTKQQMYSPPVDLDIIKAVKNAVTIPVIGNGGIESGEDAAYMYEYTGCDLVMVGQGSYGRPWIFEEIEEYLTNGIVLPQKPLAEKMEIMLAHISLMVAKKGENVAMREARKCAGWYIKGTKNAAAFRQHCSGLESFHDLEILAKEICKLPNAIF